MEHFCTCPDKACKLNPVNHDKGCDPCVKNNLNTNSIPRCFFLAVGDDISGIKDFTVDDFVMHYHRHRDAGEGKQ